MCANLIAERIAERAYPEDGVVLTGDLNAGEDETAMRILKGEQDSPIEMVDTYRVLYPDETMVGTGSNWGYEPHDGNKIDYVLAMGYINVLEAEIIYQEPGVIISDHFPVRGKIAFPGVVGIAAREYADQIFSISTAYSQNRLTFKHVDRIAAVWIGTVTGKTIRSYTEINSDILDIGRLPGGVYLVKVLNKDGREFSSPLYMRP
jgi:hypothetical protein